MRIVTTAVLLVGSVGVMPAQTRAAAEPTLGAPIGMGVLLGVAGFGVGGLAAVGIAQECSSHEFCMLEAAFYGAAAGGTLGMALGVHLGNRRRGSLPLDALTGAAVWGAGFLIVTAGDWNDRNIWIAFVILPIVQLGATVAVERASGRSRARAVGLGVGIVPLPQHRAGVVATVVF